jgi:tetratricopeptide (TPR) repeat protein/tRNA A-37 threonylcarbamoyl transferase component Bud32
MTDTHCSDDPVDDLAEEFARRWRDGERPTVEEYAARFPQWAEQIRDVFPAVLMMEEFKPRRGDAPGGATAVAAVGSTADTAVAPPARLGDYRLVREIGRGGMGVVYEAVQEPLGRPVAIKVLPGQLFSNDKLRSRFQRESRAAARLHHTNIVPVFDVGEQDGLCFYAMQLIAGRSLDAFAETRRQGDKETGRQEEEQRACSPCLPVSLSPCLSSPREVARIGVQVAEALAYAHGQGILHRDIKPSNLLLAQGVVWVTDFGVAKVVEEANLTQSGDLVGTLRYMPPERFFGQSDARGDVYSLGITLYELLGRQPAFPDTTPQHLIQLITSAELPPLRKLNPTVPTDLETVILKAIARDPSGRYQTAGELADDLRRFLDDRPVLARRMSALEGVRRWCRRNRLVAGLTAATFLLLALTSVVAVIAYLRTSAANREASAANERMKEALASEKTQRERAEKTSASALTAMNRIYEQFAPNRIVVTPELPVGGTAEEGGDLLPQPVLSPEAVPLLGELLGFYEQLAREGELNPKLRRQAAEARQRIGDIRQRLGQFEPAIAAYRKAIDLYGEAAGAEASDGAVRIKVARTYNELGRALRALQRNDEAKEAHARARQTLAEAPGNPSARPEYRYELARTYYFEAQRDYPLEPRGPGGAGGPPPRPDRGGRGRLPRRSDDFGRPPPRDRSDGQASRRAVDLLEGLVKEFPAVPEYRHLLACCYRDRPPERRRPGPPSPGSNVERAIDLLRQLVKDFPKMPDFRYDLCETLARAGYSRRPGAPDAAPKAERLLAEAVTLAHDLTTQYPNVPLYAAARAHVQDRLGALLVQLKRPDEADKAFRKAVMLQSRLVKQHPEVVAYGLSLALMQASLGRLQAERGNLKEARTLLETATIRLEELRSKGDKDKRPGWVRFSLGRSQRELSRVLTRLGENELAAQALRRADELGPERGPAPFGPRGRGGRRPGP